MPLGTGSKKDAHSMGSSFAIAKCKSSKRSDAYVYSYLIIYPSRNVQLVFKSFLW